jgi:hypothetical protein
VSYKVKNKKLGLEVWKPNEIIICLHIITNTIKIVVILKQLNTQLHRHPLEIEIQLKNIAFYLLKMQTSLHNLQTIIWTNYKQNSIIE